MEDYKIKIDKDIPIPNKGDTVGARLKYPFGTMKIGESFLTEKSHAQSAAYQYGLRHGKKFCSRRVPMSGKIRIWRIQ